MSGGRCRNASRPGASRGYRRMPRPGSCKRLRACRTWLPATGPLFVNGKFNQSLISDRDVRVAVAHCVGHDTGARICRILLVAGPELSHDSLSRRGSAAVPSGTRIRHARPGQNRHDPQTAAARDPGTQQPRPRESRPERHFGTRPDNERCHQSHAHIEPTVCGVVAGTDYCK